MKKLLLIIFLLFTTNIFADVKTIDNNGLTKILHQGYNKSIVIFWGVYCPYCKNVLKTINENYQYFQKNKINIVAISIDKKPYFVDEFVKKSKYPFNFYIDKGDLKKQYNAYYIPLTYIFDKNGHMEDSFPGNKPFSELKEYLED